MPAGNMIKMKVLPGVDTAESGFFPGVAEARKMALDSSKTHRGHLESELVTKEEAKHLGPGRADRAVRTRIGGVGRSFGRQRQPIGIGLGSRIPISVGQTNGSNRSP